MCIYACVEHAHARAHERALAEGRSQKALRVLQCDCCAVRARAKRLCASLTADFMLGFPYFGEHMNLCPAETRARLLSLLAAAGHGR